MNLEILKIIKTTLKHEGGYVNHPNDKGGETNYGITEGVARENGYRGEMKNLSKDLAVEIYYKKYWKTNNLDRVHALSPFLASYLFDYGVNAGVGRSAYILKYVLNAFSNQGKRWRPLEITKKNRIGNEEIKRLAKAKTLSIKDNLIFSVLVMATARYIRISIAREKNQVFTNGWIGRSVTWFVRYFVLKKGGRLWKV